MAEITVDETSEAISLKIVDFAELDAELLFERLNEMVPVLREIMAFDSAVANLDDSTFERRRDACAAMGLKYAGMLDSAKRQAQAAHSVAVGTLSASHVGFPEFDKG